MASPRITKAMREDITQRAVGSTFRKEAEALQKEENSLAERLYKEVYSPQERKHMEALGSRFIDTADRIRGNIRGQKITLHFGATKLVDQDNKMFHMTPPTPSQALSDDIYDFMERHKTYKDKRSKAEQQLEAMLETVVSFNKLRAVWPQGEKFYDMYDVDSEKPGVPALLVTELNAILGLK